MKQYPFIAMLALALAGCAETTSAPAEPTIQEIGRDAAVTAARRDAAHNFHLAEPAGVIASRVGRYWVVELRTPEGGALRYAIAGDGMIRERRMIQ
jgi:hypothetical protein